MISCGGWILFTPTNRYFLRTTTSEYTNNSTLLVPPQTPNSERPNLHECFRNDTPTHCPPRLRGFHVTTETSLLCAAAHRAPSAGFPTTSKCGDGVNTRREKLNEKENSPISVFLFFLSILSAYNMFIILAPLRILPHVFWLLPSCSRGLGSPTSGGVHSAEGFYNCEGPTLRVSRSFVEENPIARIARTIFIVLEAGGLLAETHAQGFCSPSVIRSSNFPPILILKQFWLFSTNFFSSCECFVLLCVVYTHRVQQKKDTHRHCIITSSSSCIIR